ncbi:Glyoxalase/bleomycin resistance protein/dioxygenase [Desulfosarcina cetonica]|uniref:VOC family protein n=1 Tax=Desulfosarcina cetonica TaxID=90730 RepID=UPI0006CF7561|nr:VOC family protein [Desulfosarcina cetonica]VTR67352.1 Glyoxalase/bleomycin resistance protein/dioxygenase [Desulfosarcina cetonica]
MKIKQLDHINIVVSDLAAATDFFRRLGFTVNHQGTLEGAWISAIVNLDAVHADYVQLAFPGSTVNIELLQYHTPSSPPSRKTEQANHIGIRHLAFAVDDIGALVNGLKAEGVEFFGDIQTYPATGKRLVYFYGPDGIILEFAEYPHP